MDKLVDRIELQPGYTISRIIKGGWHLAGGHGKVDEQVAIRDMRVFVEAGVTTFDCADIYTGVEELIGKFLRKYKSDFATGNLSPLQIHTKYVPDYNALSTLAKKDTVNIIDRSLRRLGVERLDLVQFAWWDYAIPGYVETAIHLAELQKEGKIRYIGITNFDRVHLQELLEAGVSVVSNQVQYSILDQRPEKDMQELAKAYDIKYLCYGVVAGGFLSDRYLNSPVPIEPLENRSLVKYRLIIDEFGSWNQFQEALNKIRHIANKYKVPIADVAISYILQKPKVAGVIIGARNIDHLDSLQKLSSLNLDIRDLKILDDVVTGAQGPSGPVYELERDRGGRHGTIMRYNLNEQKD